MRIPAKSDDDRVSLEGRLELLEKRLAILETTVRDYCAVLGRSSLVPRPTGDMALHFSLDDQAFCMDLAAVDEIIRMVRLSSLIDCPSICMGMIVVRGFSVPVLDLRRRLGFPLSQPGENEQIILLNIDEFRFGIIVDDVHGIIRIADGDVEVPPSFPYQAACVTGIVRYRGSMLTLINPLMLLQTEERNRLNGLLHSLDAGAKTPERAGESSPEQ